MDDKNISKKSPGFQEKLLAYHIDGISSTNPGKAEKVFKSLLNYHAYQSFLHKALRKQHYLEIVCYWIISCGPDDAFAELNEVLGNCQLEEHCLDAKEFDHINSFYTLKDNEGLSYKHREKIYDRITQECILHARYIGLFLLSLKDYVVIYKENFNQKELINAIMTEVRENYSPSWECFKALFTYIGNEKFVEEIEREILLEEDVDLSVNVSMVVNKAESMEAGYESQIVRRDPSVLVYTCCKGLYQKVTLTGEQLPKEVTLVRSGKMVPLPMNFEEYIKKCETFFKEYFKIDINNINGTSQKIHFPPAYMINDGVSKLPDQFHIDHTVIVTHYDVIEHCKLFKLDLGEISKNFQLDLGLVGNGDKKIVLCNYKLNYLCVVHYSEACDEEEALEDLKVAENYFLLFYYLFSCILGKDFSYISVVAAPNMTAKCENPLILAASDIQTISEGLKSLCCNLSTSTPVINQKGSFGKCLTFVSLLLAFVATTKVSSNVLYGSVAEKVLSVWLTTEQLEVMFTDIFWKIVVGGYGTGKTLVARYLLKHLMKYVCSKTDIYFVLFDNSSLLLKSMQEYCEDLRSEIRKDASDVDLICHNTKELGELLKDEVKELYSDLSGFIDFTISTMLLAVEQRSRKTGRRFHLIVDEVDAEILNEVEAANLKEIFSDYRDKLKESHVVFLLRSMEKKREYLSEGMSFMHKSYRHYHNCGMKLIELTHSMRVTQQVFKIMKLCMEGITNPTVIPYRGNVSKRQPSPKGIRRKLSNSDISSSSSSIKVDVNAECHVNDMSFLGLMGNQTQSIKLRHDDPNGIDQLGKVCEQEYQGSPHKLETLYTFQKCKFSQHNITGKKPQLILLNLDGDMELERMEIVKLLSVAFRNVFLSKATINEGKRLIVCSNKEEMDLCKSVNIFNKQTAFFHEADNPNYFQTCNTIITTYNGCRGLEFPLVIVIINPNDYFKRQYFIEMISRSTDHLVLIVPYCYKLSQVRSNERETVKNMLDKLILCDNPNNMINITSYKLDNSMDEEAALQNSSESVDKKLCVDGGDKNVMLTEIKINKNSEEYWKLKPFTECPSTEVNAVANVFLSNYVHPMPASNGTVKQISSSKVKFSWTHSGNHFRLELSTPGEPSRTVNNYQGHTFEITTDGSSTYSLEVYAICKFGALSSSSLKICYIPHEQREEGSHSIPNIDGSEGMFKLLEVNANDDVSLTKEESGCGNSKVKDLEGFCNSKMAEHDYWQQIEPPPLCEDEEILDHNEYFHLRLVLQYVIVAVLVILAAYNVNDVKNILWVKDFIEPTENGNETRQKTPFDPSKEQQKMLRTLFSIQNTTNKKDTSSAAEQTMKRLFFNEQSEKSKCDLKRGVHIDNFNKTVQDIGKELNLTDTLTQSIVNGAKDQEGRMNVMQTVNFISAEVYIYFGIFSIIKTDKDYVTFSYAFYVSKSVLAPREIQKEENVKEFARFTAAGTVYFSSHGMDIFSIYHLEKASQSFKKDCQISMKF